MMGLIQRCFEESSRKMIEFFDEKAMILDQEKIINPIVSSDGKWQPSAPLEDEVQLNLQQRSNIHSDLLDLYDHCRYFKLLITRKGIDIELAPLNERVDRRCTFFQPVILFDKEYFILGYGEDAVNDWTVLFDNTSGEINLLDDQSVTPFYSNLYDFLGDRS